LAIKFESFLQSGLARGKEEPKRIMKFVSEKRGVPGGKIRVLLVAIRGYFFDVDFNAAILVLYIFVI
jgi:hypothetical protein